MGLKHIEKARCTGVSIRFVFTLRGPKKCQRVYCPVKDGFYSKDGKSFGSAFSTTTSRKRNLSSIFFESEGQTKM